MKFFCGANDGDILLYKTPQSKWIDDVAAVTRSKHGSIRVHSTWAQDDSAVGGGTAFVASADLAFDDPRLDDFAAALADFVSAVEPYGGKIIETDLAEDDIKALRKGLNVATTAD